MAPDRKKTGDLIRCMRLARIGSRRRWQSMAKRLDHTRELGADDLRYLASMARTYKNMGVTRRSRIFHVALSEHDTRPPCASCGSMSRFYCNMNDLYYCDCHIVGHDENEL